MKWVYGCIGATLICWGLWSAFGTQAPLPIGFCDNLSGLEGVQGRYGRNGVQLAVLERNAAGGVGGRPVVLLVEDLSRSGVTAVSAARSLRQQGAVAMVGPITSVSSMQLLKAPELDGLVVVSPSAAASSLSRCTDRLFRVYPDNAEMVTALAEHVLDRLGLQRWVLVRDDANPDFTHDWQRLFSQAVADRGGEVVAMLPFVSTESSAFSTMLPALQQADPDGVLILANDSSTAQFCQQMLKKGLRIPSFATSWASSPHLVQLGGAGVEALGWVAASRGDDTTPNFLRFQKHYRQHFVEEPAHMALHAYEAATLLLNTLERIGVDRLSEGLESVGVADGVQGPYAIDPFGDVRRPLYLQTVQNGRIVTLPGAR